MDVLLFEDPAHIFVLAIAMLRLQNSALQTRRLGVEVRQSNEPRRHAMRNQAGNITLFQERLEDSVVWYA